MDRFRVPSISGWGWSLLAFPFPLPDPSPGHSISLLWKKRPFLCTSFQLYGALFPASQLAQVDVVSKCKEGLRETPAPSS